MDIESRLPRHPFRIDAIDELGISREQLRRLIRDGAVRRVLRAVYAVADLDDTIELRVAAVALAIGPDQVVRDRTAAWIHGVDIFTYAEREVLPPVETCVLRGSGPTTCAGVDGRTRDLSPEDIMRIDGVLLTTPLRTALDLGCILQRRDAVAALDAFCRHHDLTRQQLAMAVKRYRRRRGVIQLRDLINHVDPRAESVRESWTRIEIHDAGLPAPTPQFWIVVDGRPTYRLDLAYPRHRIAIEYDGWDSHHRTPEQRAYDEARRDWLRRNGWTVIVVRLGDFTGEALERWLGELRAALEPSYTNVRRLERGARNNH